MIAAYCKRAAISSNFITRKAVMASFATLPNDFIVEDPNIPVVVANAQIVAHRVQLAAMKAGRLSDSVRLVPVSKTKPAEAIQQLYDAGYRSFGENYFQELVEKAALLPKDIKWHFIGHLQSSKAAKLIKEVPHLAVLETIDSQKLATKLNNACESVGRPPLSVFIQVDTSGEDTKSGVEAGAELTELLLFIKEKCPFLQVAGLMTIGTCNCCFSAPSVHKM